MEKFLYSAKNISKLLDKEDEMLLYGQFLDSFYKCTSDIDREKLIDDEPIYNPDYKVFFCLLSSGVEKLANDYGLPIPKWTENPVYVLEKTKYAFDTTDKNFQLFLTKTTPDEYKKRNYMVGDNILRRC